MRRVRIWLLIAAVAAVPILMWMTGSQRTAYEPVKGPDGETVYLRGVTYGTNHLAPDVPRWLRMLPAGVRSWVTMRLPGSGNRSWLGVHTSEPTLRLWLEVVPGPDTNASPNLLRFLVADEGGQVSGKREDLSTHWPSGRHHSTLDFSILPRRSKVLGIVCYGGPSDATNLLGNWRLPNPSRSRAREWTPEPMPLTKTNGGLECTFTRVVFGVGRSTSFIAENRGGKRVELNLAPEGDEPRALLAATPRINGSETDEWVVAGVTATDATGNAVVSSTLSWPSLTNRLLLVWGPVPYPQETWNLAVALKRKSGAPFATDETVTFENLELPEPGTELRLNREQRHGEVIIRLTGAVLRPALQKDSWRTEDLSLLKVTVGGATNGVHVDLVGVTDERGARFQPRSWSSGSKSPGWSDREYGFSDLPGTARRLACTFVVHREKVFQFRVRPEIATNTVVLR